MREMKNKTPTPVTVKEASAPTLAAKRTPSGSFREKGKSEPIRPSATLSAAAEKQALNEKLLTAAWKGDINGAWDLLDKGADVNARNSLGETALHLAAHGGHPETVELLLAKKAEMNAVDKEGNTALMLACCFKQTGVISVLLEKGADVGIVGKNGVTALWYLVRLAKNDRELLDILKRGANMRGKRIHFSARVISKENGKNNSGNGSLAQ